MGQAAYLFHNDPSDCFLSTADREACEAAYRAVELYGIAVSAFHERHEHHFPWRERRAYDAARAGLSRSRDRLLMAVQSALGRYRALASRVSADDALLSVCSALLCQLHGRLVDENEGHLADAVAAELIRTEPAVADALFAPATLVVHAEPAADQIALIDTEARRVVTDSSPLSVAAGLYQLEFSRAGCPTVLRPIVLLAGSVVRVRVELFDSHLIGEKMRYVPAGRFICGGDRAAPGSGVQRMPFVDNFAISQRPVTVAEFREFVADAPEHALGHLLNLGAADLQDEQRPVTGITRDAARAYCAWLTRKTGAVHRLPRDEEWEKAVRGVDGRAYPWGAAIDLCIDESQPTAARRAQAASPFGLLGVADGQGEWTDSDFDSSGAYAVVRGGAWRGDWAYSRCAARRAVAADGVTDDVGFRVVRELAKGGGESVLPAPPLVPSRMHSVGIEDGVDHSALRQALDDVPTDRSIIETTTALLIIAQRFLQSEAVAVLSVAVDDPGGAEPWATVGQLAPEMVDPRQLAAALQQQRPIALAVDEPCLVVPLGSAHCLLTCRGRGAFPFDPAEQRALELIATRLRGLLARSAA